jgi:hypothetical protein
MACACGGKKAKAREATVSVKLPGGTLVTKNTQAAAEAFVRTHPGATIVR